VDSTLAIRYSGKNKNKTKQNRGLDTEYPALRIGAVGSMYVSAAVLNARPIPAVL
jgi:hypothetical protein